MTWNIPYLEAKKDVKRLDHAVRVQALKGIQKVAQNPVAAEQGGYASGEIWDLAKKNGKLTVLFSAGFLSLSARFPPQ